MGPGQSSRSHQADEFVLVEELEEGLTGYIAFIEELSKYAMGDFANSEK
jgi:acetylornithine deacetylase